MSQVWPEKLDLIGVPVSSTTYTDAVASIVQAAENLTPALVTACAVHGLVEARRSVDFLIKLKSFDMVTPDGQPVRYGLNKLYEANLNDRVYGPRLMLEICKACEEARFAIYLYGSSSDTVSRLKLRLQSRFKSLVIAGAEPSLYRDLAPDEVTQLVARISSSGARIVFIGLGCPRQEHFAYDNRNSIKAVQICVGAAFDFHAGVKPQAPKWMQDRALEWLFRLLCEPRRLFKRYLVTNAMFVLLFSKQFIKYKLNGELSR